MVRVDLQSPDIDPLAPASDTEAGYAVGIFLCRAAALKSSRQTSFLLDISGRLRPIRDIFQNNPSIGETGMLSPRTTASSRPSELAAHLLHRFAALLPVALVVILSIDTGNRAFSADIHRVPNIVLILADDKYEAQIENGRKDAKYTKKQALLRNSQITADYAQFMAIHGD